MRRHSIFFDLDGTLTDSGEGIINCAALALERLGLPVPPREEMGVFVGPPLRETFTKFGVPEDQTEKAIEIFRGRYADVGILENYPYPGVKEMLETLHAHGHRLFVATSKPEAFAHRVLDRFGMSGYFELICGATMDGSRDDKADVIAYLKSRLDQDVEAVMVGDTSYDVIGARKHGISTIGVSWGYGKVQDLLSAGAVQIADTPEQLISLLEE